MDYRRAVSDRTESQRTIPGPQSRALSEMLQRYESQNVTYVDEEFPVFWESAHEAEVVDVDGNRYIDLTSAFGVANVGHSNRAVVEAVAEQARMLMHGMGDVHPTAVRTRLLKRLADVLPTRLSTIFLATTGSEAVEAALKTAVIATGKHRFVSYRNAYHGLSVGALEISGIEKFVEPFAGLVPNVAVRMEYPDAQRTDAAAALARLRGAIDPLDDIAAIVIEPVQGRGGCIVPPAGYLRGLREYCDARSILLIFDEIYTGFGRTGRWFACEHERATPDILCIGKAMGGGFPISAIAATQAAMDAWPPSSGEALHTSTYLGNPMGCAAALATIDELASRNLPQRARELGDTIERRLQKMFEHPAVTAVRGRGCMWGLQLRSASDANRVVKRALARGVLLLQAGPHGDVISLTPPLVIADEVLLAALDIVEEVL